jgi:FlaA1/EpsC-like NDP-sugar epimerase
LSNGIFTLFHTLASRIIYTRPIQLAIDATIVAASFIFAYLLRFDGHLYGYYPHQMVVMLPYAVALFLVVNHLWGINRFMWRYTSFREAVAIAESVGTSAAILLIVWAVFLRVHPALRIPLGVALAHPVLVYFGLVGVRGLRRIQYNRALNKKDDAARPIRNGNGVKKRVILVGAGRAGQMLAQELERNPDMEIVGFVDDDRAKIGRSVHGHVVMGTTDDLLPLVREHGVQNVVLSMPSAATRDIRRIVRECERSPVKVLSVPSLTEIVEERVAIGRLRQVHMEDLLGRAAVENLLRDERLLAHYSGKRMMVTGAAGSIGSELVRQIGSLQPDELVLLDKDENGLYEVGLEMKDRLGYRICEVVANVRDRERLARVLKRTRPQVIFHAAAYKHVPMMEAHPSEAILNNVVGTRNLLELSGEAGTDGFVMISTDKAVNPTSIMGASKRVAEMILRNHVVNNGHTRYCCVRFGNVLGSRASVVPLFQKRIAEGKNIPVTHPDIRRYFMTIPEAVQLVIQAGSLATNAETFVLDMGDPVRIVDLARELIQQSGLVLGQDIDIEFTGLRPGEKLYEEPLIDEEDRARSTDYPKIFVAEPLFRDWAEASALIAELVQAAERDDAARICDVLQRLDIGYHPTLNSALNGPGPATVERS